ncbi:hypothetical protein [Nocardioides marmorisolisilvae]|nr:hypothetical protein [Nocardioides marmorisolisilvae]
MTTPTAPEPEIVPGTSRPIPVQPEVQPNGDPATQPDPEPQPEHGQV